MKLHLTLTTSIALSIAASAQAQPRETLGGPGGARGDGSYGMNINSAGHNTRSSNVLPRGPQRAVYGGTPLRRLATLQAGGTDRFSSYIVEDLGTLGGPCSFAYNLNNAGIVSGGAETASQIGDCSQLVVNAPQTAVFWDHGSIHPLGTLGGPDSVGAATTPSRVAVVDSETAQLSRLGEDVCGFGTKLQCLAAIWKNGQFSQPLQLLSGGDNSYALDMNDRGQVVGFSDTGDYDLDCAGATTAGFLFRAVLWDENGTVHPLEPLGADTVSFAFGINNRGQIVGSSGVCGNTTPPPYPSAPHAVLWDRDGTVKSLDPLGSLGGPAGASAINNRGDVSGTYLAADGSPQAFLWTSETQTPIPLKPPDGFVAAINGCCKTINDKREIVGFMFDAEFNSYAFLWKDGVMVDLNRLIPTDSPWVLQSAAGINDSGQITGSGLINGEVHAFLATPRTAERNPGARNDP